MRPPFAIALGLIALPALATDEPNAPRGAQIVVTATRMAQPVRETLSDVTVIGPEEIAQAGQSTLAELLSRQPGVEFISNGGLGAATDLFIRGTNKTHTLVLVDGMRVNSASTGTTSIQHIPLEQIDRIEILRGPGSSLYGADAIGGVIQIFTKAGSGRPGWNVAAGAGSYGTYRVSGGATLAHGDTSIGVQLSHLESADITAINGPDNLAFNPDRDPYLDRSVSAQLTHRLAPGHELGAAFLLIDAANHYDSGSRTRRPPTNTFDFHKKETLVSQRLYSNNQLTDAWQSRLSLGASADDLTDYGNTGISVVRTDETQAQWQNEIKAGPGTALLAAEWLDQKVEGTTNFRVKERHIGSLLAGYQAKLGANALQANVRRDDNSQFGSRDTGSIAWGYTLSPAWSFSASAANAFNAPTFNQLYHPTSGNPNVRPERAQSREASVRYAGQRHEFGLLVYENRITDLIQFVGTSFVATNVDRARIRGTGLTWRTDLAGWDVNAALDLQEPVNAVTGKQLQRRAEKNLKLGLDRSAGAWLWTAELQAAGPRFDDEANTKPMGGYGIVNLAAQYRLNAATRLTARVNNVFDKRYELAKDFNTPGANLFVGLQYEAR